MTDKRAKPTLSPHAVRRLTLSRYYLNLAKEHSRVEREADAFVTINLLHEAIETFLVAAAEHMNLQVKARTEFSTYLDKLDEEIAPQRLPFRTMLNRLNKARVQAKHDSIVPDRAEIPNFVASSGAFLSEATDILFKVTFSSVSLIDLLNPGEVKEHLNLAQVAFESNRHADVLIECRKALYLVFEQRFDISAFASEETKANALWPGLFCDAPFYARSAKYINDSVLEPFDFIVLDHARLDSDLVKDGIDPLVYWNLWRLTPEVYKPKEGDWLIKNEPDKTTDGPAADNAAYVLENTVTLIHQRERKRQGIRTIGRTLWQLRVRNAGANAYRKASKDSEIIGKIPHGLEHVQVQSGTPGLDGGYYWRVLRTDDLKGEDWFSGYVSQDDLAFD